MAGGRGAMNRIGEVIAGKFIKNWTGKGSGDNKEENSGQEC